MKFVDCLKIKVHRSKNALSEFIDLSDTNYKFMDPSDINYKLMGLKMHF